MNIMNNKDSKQTKVFGIGFPKTGTTSLAIALRKLGYNVSGPGEWRGVDNLSKNVLIKACSLVDQYDAFQDTPWPILYKELDRNFPGSKYILTLRDTDSWIESQIKHYKDYGSRDTPMRILMYGVGNPEINESYYREKYEKHNRDVIDYFKNRENDLLVINFADGNVWEKLCPFLETGIPNIPFPHSNKSITRKRSATKLTRQTPPTAHSEERERITLKTIVKLVKNNDPILGALPDKQAISLVRGIFRQLIEKNNKVLLVGGLGKFRIFKEPK